MIFTNEQFHAKMLPEYDFGIRILLTGGRGKYPQF